MNPQQSWQSLADKLKHIPAYLIDHVAGILVLSGVIASVDLLRKDGEISMKKFWKAVSKGLAEGVLLGTAFAVLEK